MVMDSKVSNVSNNAPEAMNVFARASMAPGEATTPVKERLP